MVRADDVRPIRILWSDRHGENSVGLGGVHKILARDPALGLALLRGLQDWEQGRVVSTAWGPARPYTPSTWAHMAEVGWVGCEEGDRWREMGGGEGEERGNAATTTPNPQAAKPPPPNQPNPPPPASKTNPNPKSKHNLKRKRFESDDESDSESAPDSSSGVLPPPQEKEQPPPTPEDQGHAGPQAQGGREGGGGGKGGGDKKKDGGPDDPLVGSSVHVPYPTGVEVGTVTGAHARKSGVVWVRYPDNPELYEMPRGLLFTEAEAAAAHPQKARPGKKTPINPPAKPQTDPANPPTNRQEVPKPHQTTTTEPTSSPKDTQPTAPLWDPKNGSQEV